MRRKGKESISSLGVHLIVNPDGTVEEERIVIISDGFTVGERLETRYEMGKSFDER